MPLFKRKKKPENRSVVFILEISILKMLSAQLRDLRKTKQDRHVSSQDIEPNIYYQTA